MATKQRLSAEKLKDLESKFAATLVVSSLLSKRGIPCTISNLSKQVYKMCNNKPLTLTDLQMIHNIVPSICYIRCIQYDQIKDHSDDNHLYELKFSFPITPSNISTLLKKFKTAASNKQSHSKKRKLSQNNDDDYSSPNKRRKLNNHNNTNNYSDIDTDDNVLELDLKPLPPKDLSRNAKVLKPLTFDPLSFMEQSKTFTFWSDDNIVSSKLLPPRVPTYDELNIADDDDDADEAKAPTSIRITEIPSVLVSTYKLIKRIDILNKIYCHQTKGINSICRGYHNIIATSTASGKSLIYNIPVLSHIIHTGYKSQNLYLFPTKALAQDQLRSLNMLCLQSDINISCATYDGDTPYDTRSNILLNANIILTNPDIIHQTLLPLHAKYKSLFSNISFIVIDESHYYSSIFGCHFANIIRRLKRVCAMYGSHPLFIGCSATINNPLQHFSYLTGIKSCDIHVVDHTDDTSANASKLFIFWRPPLKKGVFRKKKQKNAKSTKQNNNTHFHIEHHLETVRNARNESASRRSAFVESAMLFSQCIMSKLRCILFVKQRSVCELVYKYARDILFKSDINGDNYMNLIKSYRGGYNKELRRKIESDLFNDDLLGIISTNAMELGVDIGDLDCTLHIGYTGLSSLWQQAGRSGRSGNASLAIFISQNSVIDEYIIHHNEMLFDATFENTIIFPYNKQILYSHLLCAIADEPMDKNEIYTFWDILDDKECIERHRMWINEIMNELVNDEKIIYHKSIKKWFLSPKYLSHLAYKLYHTNDIPNYSNNVHPAKCIAIRNMDGINYSVHIEGTNEKLDEMEQHNAFFHVFPGAIYLNQGKEYVITNLDIKNHKAHCKEISYSKYYTLSRDRTDILITNTIFTSQKYNTLLHFGQVEIRTSVFAFYKISKMNAKILDENQLNLPNLINNTVALWMDIPPEIVIEMNEQKIDIISAIHSIEHCMIDLIPLFIKCASNEFETECPSPFDTRKRMPRIIISEKTANGLGYVEEIVIAKNGNIIQQLIQKTMETLSNCSCGDENDDSDGCLACCHSNSCHEYNIVSSRKNALALLSMLQPVFA